ncbi:MAG: ATP-binding cassette domain-containing protein [Chloroflexota bacterium]
MAKPVIQTENLTKVYKTRGREPFTALRNLDLTVQEGEIFGYLGPNGAGKTTTIRMLLDLIRPTKGHARIFGMDANAQSVELHKQIGFLPGELSLWRNQKSIDVIKYIGRLRGGVNMVYVNELTEILQFDTSKRVREYSTGNKRKLGLIIALMNQPKLLILDEPTSGLDPLMQQQFNRLMRDFRANGGTVFLSSHVLSEVQAICDRVGVLRGGELQAVERVEALTDAAFRWVNIRYQEAVRILDDLKQVPDISDLTVENNTVKLRISGDFDPLLRAATGQYVVSMDVIEPSLEEIFLAFYNEDKARVSREALPKSENNTVKEVL